MRNVTEMINDIESGKLDISRIYVCSPLSAKTKEGTLRNMLLAKDKCCFLNGMFKSYGIKAWAPHAYLPTFLDDSVEAERNLALKFGMELLGMSDIIYVFGPKLSEGMKGEINYAIENEMDIIVDGDIVEIVKAYVKEKARELKGE